MAKDSSTKVDNSTDVAKVTTSDDGSQGNPPATVANVRYKSGQAPGDTAKNTVYETLDGRLVNSADAGEADGFRGTVIVQEGDTITAGVARRLAEQ